MMVAMMGSMVNALLSFITEAVILSSSEFILFGLAILGYMMVHSFSSLRSAEDKRTQAKESVVTELEFSSQEVLRRFERGDYQGVVALWPAVMCSGCVPSGAALSQIIESMQRLGMQVQVIAGDIRRALKQNTGLCEDAEGLCHLLEDLRRRGCACLLQALLSVFEEVELDIGQQMAACAASPGCVPQELPSSTGQHGHVEEEDEDASAEQAIVLSWTSPQDPNLASAKLLGGLTPDLAAHVFSFTELSDVLNCGGVACRGLHNAIWCQPDFWVAVGGPAFVNSFRCTERPTSIVPMIGCFRRWVFGLDGDWSLQVEQLGSCGHPTDALRSVLGYIQVLQVGDAALSDIWRLVRAAENAMQRAEVQDKVVLSVASELVATCQKRQDILGSVDNKDLTTALEAMEKRAEKEKLVDERNHWFFSDETDSSEQSPWHTTNEDHNLLSLSFLAVMDQQ
jgi:hypothetical protein